MELLGVDFGGSTDWMIGSFPPNPRVYCFGLYLGDIHLQHLLVHEQWLVYVLDHYYGTRNFGGIELDLYAHLMAPVNEPTRIQ